MRKNIILDDRQYSDAPVEVDEAFDRSVEISADFLPAPEELAKAVTKKSITIRLNTESIEYFKKEAKEHGTHYQTMIDELLSEYVKKQRKIV